MPARELDPAHVAAYRRLQLLASTATTDDEAREVANQLRAFARRVRAARWEPYVWQRPHLHPPGWVSQRDARLGVCDERCADLPVTTPGVHQWWVQRGGRGTGKTDAASHYVNAHMEGPPCDPRVPGGHRMTIAGPTQADAVSSCVTGVSGVQAINPAITVVGGGKEGTIVRWPNGAVGRVLGADSARAVQRARAWTNVCLWWLEEFAAMPLAGGLAGQPGHEADPVGMLDQAPFTLRLGPNPHGVLTTTPTGREEVGVVLDDPANVQTWGRTRDADKLPIVVRESLERKYPPGTTIGRQELDGERVGDVAGALWVQQRSAATPPEDDRPGIDNDRVGLGTIGWRPHSDVSLLVAQTPEGQKLLDHWRSQLPAVPTAPVLVAHRAAIGVDPAGGATENGVSCVLAEADHAYTIADLSHRGGPTSWGIAAVLAWQHFGAEGIALERTFGGDQTNHVIATAARELGLPLPAFLQAKTQEGKKERALPVQTLGQVHRLHMVGSLPKLEGELTTWVEADTESPNRLDAWVHAHRHLLVRARTAHVAGPSSPGGPRIPGR